MRIIARMGGVEQELHAGVESPARAQELALEEARRRRDQGRRGTLEVMDDEGHMLMSLSISRNGGVTRDGELRMLGRMLGRTIMGVLETIRRTRT